MRESLIQALTDNGVCVVKLYRNDEKDFNGKTECWEKLMKCEELGTPCGAKGNSLVKNNGIAMHPSVMEIRLDSRAKQVYSCIYDMDDDLSVSLDAVGFQSQHAVYPVRKRRVNTAKDQYELETNLSSVALHIDVGYGTTGREMEERMAAKGFSFPFSIQSQILCQDSIPGGAAFVAVPGNYIKDDSHLSFFDVSNTMRDHCQCTDEGYAFFEKRWGCVAAEAGDLILWLSRTPHGNKLADYFTSPSRRSVMICWSPRSVCTEQELLTSKQKKIKCIQTGGSMTHWPLLPALSNKILSGGWHYSDRSHQTPCLYKFSAPDYGPDLQKALLAAL